MTTTLEATTYPLATLTVLLFGVVACYITYSVTQHSKKLQSKEFFLTARNAVGWFAVGWSFYAAQLGSWALFAAPSYALITGVHGVCAYAIASGLPTIVIAAFGKLIHKRFPSIISISDFANRRFGPVVMALLSVMFLFNMGVMMTSEFSAVGDLFEFVIGSARWPIVVVIAVVTAAYTTLGGLYVSIITDQFQSIVSIVLLLVITIYVGVTFDAPLKQPLPTKPGAFNVMRPVSGEFEEGRSSWLVMSLAVMTGSMFSEGPWQRCWASMDSKSLFRGAIFGSILSTLVVFVYSFLGLLAWWGDLWAPRDFNDAGTTVLFTHFNDSHGQPRLGILVVVALASVTFTTSAIDTFQNAVVDHVAGIFSRYLKFVPLMAIRALVLVLTAIPAAVSMSGYSVIQFFLLANLVTLTATVPLLAGVLQGKWATRVVTPFTVVFATLLSLASIFVYARVIQSDGGSCFNFAGGAEGIPGTGCEDYVAALHYTFLDFWAWQPFLLALSVSIVGLPIGFTLETAVRLVRNKALGHAIPLWAPARQLAGDIVVDA